MRPTVPADGALDPAQAAEVERYEAELAACLAEHRGGAWRRVTLLTGAEYIDYVRAEELRLARARGLA